MQSYVYVYSRPGVKHATQLPPPPEDGKPRRMFDEAYVDYLYALMSLLRVFLV